MTDKPLSPAAAAAAVRAAVNAAYEYGGMLDAFRAEAIAAAALRALAHNVDWESGDPKFLALDIADELEAER